MNDLVFNQRPDELMITGYGKVENASRIAPVSTDTLGRMILSPSLDIQVQGSALDIRPLNEGSDSAAITCTDLDIRNLTGAQDSVGLSTQYTISNSQTSIIAILGTVIFLPTDVSAYRQNLFYVSNTSGISVGVTVSLEIAPVNTDSYYVTDSASFSLLGGGTLLLAPTRLMKYARVRVTGLLSLATVTAYYLGRT